MYDTPPSVISGITVSFEATWVTEKLEVMDCSKTMIRRYQRPGNWLREARDAERESIV